MSALQRLGKWRILLAGWQLGTRPKGDPECDAVSDHREATLILRAEVSALAQLMVDRGLVTAEDYTARVEHDADLLCMALEARFPGVKATDHGLEIDARAADTMRGWKR